MIAWFRLRNLCPLQFSSAWKRSPWRRGKLWKLSVNDNGMVYQYTSITKVGNIGFIVVVNQLFPVFVLLTLLVNLIRVSWSTLQVSIVQIILICRGDGFFFSWPSRWMHKFIVMAIVRIEKLPRIIRIKLGSIHEWVAWVSAVFCRSWMELSFELLAYLYYLGMQYFSN